MYFFSIHIAILNDTICRIVNDIALPVLHKHWKNTHLRDLTFSA